MAEPGSPAPAPLGPGARLVVLGVAQDGGHPQAGCTLPCCEGAWRAGRRSRVACLGVVVGEQRFLFDCTPDLPSQLRDLGGPPLHGILLTHAHMGHYTGLLHLGAEAWAPRGVPVYAMPGMAGFLKAHAPWSALPEGGHVDLRPLEANTPQALGGGVTATPLLVPHRGPWSETVAFRIAGPRASALYVPDIDRWDDWDLDPVEVIAGVDRAYVDGSFFSAGEVGWRDADQILHPLVEDTLRRFAPLPAAERAKVTFIHLNHTNPLLDRSSEAHRQVIDAGFRVAADGETSPL
jgi:pyrroloquinoline quinone biosynthesis protein B